MTVGSRVLRVKRYLEAARRDVAEVMVHGTPQARDTGRELLLVLTAGVKACEVVFLAQHRYGATAARRRRFNLTGLPLITRRDLVDVAWTFGAWVFLVSACVMALRIAEWLGMFH